MKNKLIVFEGIDGAGKATQAKLLANRLKKEGRTVTSFSFPRYERASGKFIKESLAGAHGDFLKLDAYFTAFPYMTDRVLAAPEVREALRKGVVICDRYTPSNLAFGGAKLSRAKRPAFAAFAERIEYEEGGLPRPDVIVYLRMPASRAQKQLQKSGKKLDHHERSHAYLKQVAAVYDDLSKGKEWIVIECGAPESPADIHERIWTALRKKIS